MERGGSGQSCGSHSACCPCLPLSPLLAHHVCSGLTVASLLIAVAIISVGFALAGDPKSVRVWRTCLVGCVGGGGVAAMHYTGMTAMVCQAQIEWDVGIVAASVLVGIFAATAALLIFFHLSHLWQDDWRLQAATACVMGVAVNSMHYGPPRTRVAGGRVREKRKSE